MAWKPKTIAGKILKGAVIGGGALFGISAGLGAVTGAVKGTGALFGASKGIGGLVQATDKVARSAAYIATGKTKEQRNILKEAKKEANEAAAKLDMVKKLIGYGYTEKDAMLKVGLSVSELDEIEGAQVEQKPMNKTVIFAGLGLLVLLFMFSKRR